MSASVRRLLPEPGQTTIAEDLAAYEPFNLAHAERPFTALNFATTLDGRAAIEGRSGGIGSKNDMEMLRLLRTRFDAIMIGAGTLRSERYGRILTDRDLRAERERDGLAPDPLAVIISGRFDIPWDAPLFTDGNGEVLIFTASEDEAPETATPVQVERHEEGLDLTEAMRHLRRERGVRALLCEGGPTLHGQLQGEGLADELSLTIAPKLSGGEGPHILEGGLPDLIDFEIINLLEADGELFARYRRRA